MAPTAALHLAHQLAATGTRIDDRHVRVDGTCRQIARRLGRSPGTISQHLRQLGRLGVRVSIRPLILDTSALDQPATAEAEPVPVGESASAVAAVAAIERLVELAAQVPEIADVARVAVEAIGRIMNRAPRDEPAAQTPRTARSSRADLLGNEVEKGKPLPTSESRDVARSSRKPSEAVSLCGPIMDRSGRQAKPTAVTHQQGLTDALAQYTDGQVTSAVAAFCAEPWDSIDHPLAVFVRRAQIGHALFTDDPPAVDLREPETMGERPTLVTEAAHLLDADGFDRNGQVIGREALADIRAGLRRQRVGS